MKQTAQSGSVEEETPAEGVARGETGGGPLERSRANLSKQWKTIQKALHTPLIHRQFFAGSLKGTINASIACGTRWVQGVGALLYPPYCTVCLRATPQRCFVCEDCLSGAQALLGAQCRQCSRPYLWPREDSLAGGIITPGEESWSREGARELYPGRCADCLSRDLAFESAVVAYRASGVVREVVHQFKYHGKQHLAGCLADWLVSRLADERLQDPPVDLLVPVPLYWRKLWKRGFNQAALLAREVHRRSGLPVVGALRRIRDTGSQTRLHRKERMGNLSGAFKMRLDDAVTNRHVLLIDDVLTTGATLDACAIVLRKAGALSVRALAVARG